MGTSQPIVAAGSYDLFGGVDPRNLRVLVVDSKTASRQDVVNLLQDCSYQVTGVRTSKEAVQCLSEQQESSDPNNYFDLILKDHEPPNVDATRLLRKLANCGRLHNLPVVVMSSQDNRGMVMECLKLGAVDYLIKPLRRNEIRNIWTRVWWRRMLVRLALETTALHSAATLQFQQHGPPGPTQVVAERQSLPPLGIFSSDSKETNCVDEQGPASKEGSAPDATGSGGDGSKEGNEGSGNLDVKTGHGSNTGNGNSGSGGNGASKNENRGSNGNGCSTSRLAVAGSGNQAAQARGGNGEVLGFTPGLHVGSEVVHLNGESNGNGSGDNGRTGTSTLKHHGKILNRHDVREFEKPITRAQQHEPEVNGEVREHGFRTWVPGAAQAGKKRPHSVAMAAAVTPSSRPGTRHGRSMPFEAPSSTQLEASATGQRALQPQQSRMPATLTRPSNLSFDGQSDATQLPTPQHIGGLRSPAPATMPHGLHSHTTPLLQQSQLLSPPAKAHAVPSSGPPPVSMPPLPQVVCPMGMPSGNGSQPVFWPAMGAGGPHKGPGPPQAEPSQQQQQQQCMFPQQQALTSNVQQGGEGSMQQAAAAAQYGAPPFLMFPPPAHIMPGWPHAWMPGRMPAHQPDHMTHLLQRMSQQPQGAPANIMPQMQRPYPGTRQDHDASAEAISNLQHTLQQLQQQHQHLQHLQLHQQQQQLQQGMPPLHPLAYMNMAGMGGMQGYWPRAWAPGGGPFTGSSGGPANYEVPAPAQQASMRSHDAGNGGTHTGAHDDKATSKKTMSSGKTMPADGMLEPTRKERRAQALTKFKEKRRNLVFTKKIRYETRKQLADMRPRVKGQFVRMNPSSGNSRGVDEDKDMNTNGNSLGGAKDNGYEDDVETDVEADEEMDDARGGAGEEDGRGKRAACGGLDEYVESQLEGEDEAGGRHSRKEMQLGGGGYPHAMPLHRARRDERQLAGHAFLTRHHSLHGSNHALTQGTAGKSSGGEVLEGGRSRNSSDSGSNSPDRML